MSEVETVLTEERRRRLAAFINTHGVERAKECLSLHREPIFRLCAGLPVRRATLVVASAAIDKLPPAPTPRVLAASPNVELPPWLSAWADKHLNAKQREIFDAVLAANTPERV